MTTELLEKPASEKKDPAPVVLRSLHDYGLTTTALEHRADELKKLSKKNKDEGYYREARAIDADASSIESHILPCFRNQRELELVSHDKLQEEIIGALRRHLTLAFAGLDQKNAPATTPESLANRRENALKAIAERVTLFAIDVADDAFNQGFAAREQESRAIVLRSLSTLRISE